MKKTQKKLKMIQNRPLHKLGLRDKLALKALKHKQRYDKKVN